MENIQPQLNYKQRGEGEAIVFISGLNADMSFWGLVTDKFSSDFKAITFDNRGIGKTGIFDLHCSTELMAADIIELLDHLAIEKAHIIGHSLGGCVAQQFAIHYPERIKKLVLCSTQASCSALKLQQINFIMEMMHSNVAREIIVKHSLNTLYSNHFFEQPEKVKAALMFALAKPFEESRKTYFYQIEALLNHNTETLLHKISCPTLLIGGEEDLSTPINVLRNMQKKIPHAKLVSIANMGHMLPIEQPEVFYQHVMRFLFDYCTSFKTGCKLNSSSKR